VEKGAKVKETRDYSGKSFWKNPDILSGDLANWGGEKEEGTEARG